MYELFCKITRIKRNILRVNLEMANERGIIIIIIEEKKKRGLEMYRRAI